MGAVTKDMAALEAQVRGIQSAMRQVQMMPLVGGKGRAGMVNTQFINDFSLHVRAQREQLMTSVNAMGDFEARSVRVADGIQSMTDKIKASKMGFREFAREMRTGGIKDVVSQQIANRRSTVMQYGRLADGSLDATVITPPREHVNMWRDLRASAQSYNEIIGHVSQATINWGKNTQWAGRQITAGFTMPIMMAGAAAGKMYYDIDKGLTQIVKVYEDAEGAVKHSDAQIRQSAMDSAGAMASAYGQAAAETLDITGQLAAIGMAGVELQEMTAEVSRARILGEIDMQEVMKSTITLQSVWNMSTQELAESFNYMNAMENSTVLTMDDFVQGIPKVAGIIKELNGDVQEAGTLLLALKAGGIDAAEGATAIKSIAFKVMAPTSASVRQFTEATGQAWSTVMEGADSVIERLRRFGEATKELDMETRVGLVQRLFGLHQGSKALTIIGQLVSGSDQMTRAFDVAMMSSEEWADTAAFELEKLTKSDWSQFQQALQTLKISVSEIGKVFLPIGTKVLEVFDNIINWFMALPSGIKKPAAMIAAAFAALGPILMMVGIGANAAFSGINILSNVFGILIGRSKLMSAEEIARQKLSKITQRTVNDEATAYRGLTQAIEQHNRALSHQIALQAAKTGRYDLINDPYFTSASFMSPGGIKGKPKGMTKSEWAQHLVDKRGLGVKPDSDLSPGLASQMPTIVNGTGQAAENVKKMSLGAKVFGVSMAASMASMALGGNTFLDKIGQATFMITALGPLVSRLPIFDGRVMSKVAGAFGTVGDKASTAASSMVMGLKSIGPAVASALPALAAVGVAAGAAFFLMRRHINEAKKEMEALNNTAKSYSEVLGFTFTEAGERISDTGEVIKTTQQQVKEFVDGNADAVAAMRNQVAQAEEAGVDRRRAILDLAVSEGVKALDHGATAEQAKQAAIIAAKSIDNTLRESALSAEIDAILNFENQREVSQQRLQTFIDTLDFNLTNKRNQKGFWENFWTGPGGLSGAQKAAIEGQVEEMRNYISSAMTEEEQRERFREFVVGSDATRQKMFEDMRAKYAKEFERLGITSADEFDAALKAGMKVSSKGDIKWSLKDLGISTSDANEYYRQMQKINFVIQDVARVWNVLEGQDLSKAWDMGDIENLIFGVEQVEVKVFMKLAQAKKNYERQLSEAAAAGRELSEAERLALLNAERWAMGLDAATHSSQGFKYNLREVRDEMEAFSNISWRVPSVIQNNSVPTLDRLGFGTENVEELMNEYKSISSAASETFFKLADTTAQNIMQDREAALARGFENARTALDARFEGYSKSMAARHEAEQESLSAAQEAGNKRFEQRQKDFKARWDKMSEDLKKSNENRRKQIEAGYDSRIEKIQEVIDIEQEAEKTRQKIFEAEKTRLSRLSQMANKNIDFNVALNTGDLDAAARISNDMLSTHAGWLLDDAEEAVQSAYDKRQEKLKGDIKDLEDRKKAELDRIKDVEEAEKKALDARRVRAEEQLALERENMRKSHDQQKKALQRRQAAEREAHQKQLQAEQKALADKERAQRDSLRREEQAKKLALDVELSLIRAYVPRNEAERKEQMRRIEAAYDDYGIKLNAKGTVWSKNVGKALETQIRESNNRIANNTDWRKLGEAAARNMTEGAFGISMEDFVKWVGGGPVPAGLRANRSGAVKKSADGKYYITSTGQKFFHTGGIVGRAGDGGRTGISGKYPSQSEHVITALTGEAILNRRATKMLGTDAIDFLNRGDKIPKNIGGPDLATGGYGMAAIIASAGIIKGFQEGIKAIGLRQAAAEASGPVVGESRGALYPGGWMRPAAGRVSSRFGYRIHPILGTRRLHGGSDIAAPMGTPVYAARGGTVRNAVTRGWGNHVTIAHGGGLSTLYAHLSRFGLPSGSRVRTGQYIGNVGSTGMSTGPHLHFEYYVNGSRRNPGTIIPGLKTGGYTMSDGLANLHKGETILTAPLSEKLKVGIDNLADGGLTQLTLDMRGATINGIDDLENAIDKILDKKQNRVGRRRTIKS